MRRIVCLLLLLMTVGCLDFSGNEKGLLGEEWGDIESQARGSLVRLYLSGQDQATDDWLDASLTDALKRRYGIVLVRVPLGAEVVMAKLLAEMERGITTGDVDLFWMSDKGVTAMRESGTLFGPFAMKLPNYVRHVDKSEKDVSGGCGIPLGQGRVLVIPGSASNKAGALVVANLLLSPDLQDSPF